MSAHCYRDSYIYNLIISIYIQSLRVCYPFRTLSNIDNTKGYSWATYVGDSGGGGGLAVI